VRLRGKDSNLDYLIQSYRPLMSMRLILSFEMTGFQENPAAVDDAHDVG
jgi:hypothetical protein